MPDASSSSRSSSSSPSPPFGPSTYGDAFADVYDEWYGDRWDPDAAVAALATLAGRGPVVELGVGTGRLALGLTGLGVPVVGIDASLAMLARLEANDPAGRVAPVAADLAVLPLRRGSASLVYASHNTFFAASSLDAGLAEGARVLAPGGLLVLDLFVPGEEPPTRERRADVARLDADTVVLTLTDRDPDRRLVTGQHVELGDRGVRLRPWRIGYASPADIDRLAADVGLELRSRHADWAGSPFTGDQARHVSVYRRTGAA